MEIVRLAVNLKPPEREVLKMDYATLSYIDEDGNVIYYTVECENSDRVAEIEAGI